MKTWRVWYHFWFNGHIYESITWVKANSFDEAIAKARELDERYDSAQMVDEDA